MRKPKTSRLPGGWYGLSLALHILAAALVWFTPLRSVIDEIIERREEAAREYAMSSEQVRKLSEVIGESAENRVRNNVQRLAEIPKRMDELREDQLEEYRKTGLPGDDGDGDARRALEAMKQALEEARAARDEIDKLDKAKSDTLEERLDAIEEAQENELPLELPAAASVSAPRTDNLLIVSVDASGGIYLGSNPATKTMLHERLAEAGKVNPGQPVRIDGDRAAPYEAIVHVLDICDFEGLTNVKIKTRPGSGSK